MTVPNLPPDKKRVLILVVGVIAVVFILLILASLLKNVPGENLFTRFFQKPTPTPNKKPIYSPLPQGKQVYNVSRGSGSKGPNIKQVIIDPFDPKPGEKQTFHVKIQNEKEVKSASVTLITDNKSQTEQLTLKEGNKTDGIWETTLTTSDTHQYLYRTLIESADDKNDSQVELSFR